MAEPFPPSQGANQTKSTEKEPILVQLDSKSLHSALKEFFEPLRTNDSRADFFAVYRKEAAEFDKDYVQKYDEDLNTTLIFAGLFSAVSSAFVIDVQSKLEPDPNDMTAAYMKILINAVNGSLFPDADPGAAVWTGPPPGIVTVQALLYASLVTSLFAVFVAALGKQWVNRYIRSQGGSAADKSRDRQRKLDGFEKWHFRLVIESLPIMLQLAVLLLGCALSRYLWTISRPIAGMILAITLLGVTIYVLLTLAATVYYNCPYQTPPSVMARTIIGYLSHSNSKFTRSLRSLTTPFPSITDLRKFLRHLRSGARHVARVFGCTPVVIAGTEHIPLAVVTAAPDRVFEDVVVDWEMCKADARCIAWILDSTTDIDVIFSTVRFAADMIWYPGIAGALSPHALADLYFDCFLDNEIIPNRLEHAISIGMALASVLSVQLSVEPESETLKALCQRILNHPYFQLSSRFQIQFSIVEAPAYVAASSSSAPGTAHCMVLARCMGSALSRNDLRQLSTTHKLWLTRVELQALWRRQRVQGTITRPQMPHFPTWMVDGGQNVIMIRTNCFLIAAISLGLQIDLRDLYVPNNIGALRTAICLFDQLFQIAIQEGNIDSYWLRSLLVGATHLDPLGAMGTGEMGFLWIREILNSGYPEKEQCLMASEVVRLLWRYRSLSRRPSYVQSAWVPPLLKFLSLCENFPTTESPPHPALITLGILSGGLQNDDFDPIIPPTLASMLSSDHPLRSRKLALAVFRNFTPGWFPQMETVSGHHLSKLLQAVGDPFHFPLELPQLETTVEYQPMKVAVALIEFASSELWWSHLRPSNFASCEDILSTDEGRRSALLGMFWTALWEWPEYLCTPAKIVTVVRRLEGFGCLNTARVVITWGWVAGMADVMDQESWKLIESETLRFYRAHGMRSLVALKRCIIQNTNMGLQHDQIRFFEDRSEGPPFRAGRSRRPANLSDRTEGRQRREEMWTDCVISQACQLRRLYHLFGYDPATWQEAAGAEVDEKREVLSGRSFTPDPFIGWECDYP